MKLSNIKKHGSYYSPWKVLHQREDIEKLKRGELFAPKDIQVDLEAYCPHSCEFCSYRNVNWQGHGMQFEEPEKRIPEETGLPKEVALRLPREMYEAGIPSIELTGGGEPLVYPYIREFLDELSEYSVELAVVTNGASLNTQIQSRLRNLKWIRFSVDAATAETYSKVHRVPQSVFPTVLKHIREVVERDYEDCMVGISYVITRHNFQEIEAAADLCKSLGVNSVRYTFTYDPEGNGAMEPEQVNAASKALDQARKRETDEFRVFGTMRRLEFYSQPNTDFDFCGYQFFTWAIGYDGSVYPCCIMKYHKGFSLGNLKNHSLTEIVQSPERQKFINEFNVRNCKPCWLRDKNQFIEYVVADKPHHINFV